MGKRSASCWPSKQQELLLKASLSQQDDSKIAWEKWKQCCEIQSLDQGSLRLIPLLYKNLCTLSIEDPLIDLYRAHYQQSWIHGTQLLQDFSNILSLLGEHGIPTLLFKGAALVIKYYKDPALRPMTDCDVLVPKDKALECIQLLHERGWHPIQGFTWERVIDRMHLMKGVNIAHNKHSDVDLHWHLLRDFVLSNVDETFWESSIPIEINGIQTRTLDPTDQLYQTLAHGHRWNEVAPIRWIADATFILNATDTSILWDRIVQTAQRTRLTMRIRSALSYLSDTFALPIPKIVLDEMASISVDKAERMEYEAMIHPASSRTGPVGAIEETYYRYKRFAWNSKHSGRRMSFLDYLKLWWNARHWIALPILFIKKMARRIVLKSTDMTR